MAIGRRDVVILTDSRSCSRHEHSFPCEIHIWDGLGKKISTRTFLFHTSKALVLDPYFRVRFEVVDILKSVNLKFEKNQISKESRSRARRKIKSIRLALALDLALGLSQKSLIQ